jgi:hypothetical protein
MHGRRSFVLSGTALSARHRSTGTHSLPLVCILVARQAISTTSILPLLGHTIIFLLPFSFRFRFGAAKEDL